MKHAGWIVAAAVVLLALTQGRQTAGPMQPVPVAMAVVSTFDGNGDAEPSANVFRLWSDGGLDVVPVDGFHPACPAGKPPFICDGPIQILPGTCPGDITHDGAVATADLLGVLETWGPCE